MIFDSLKNKDNYKDLPLIYQALCYLGKMPPEHLPAPNTILINDQLFCNPVLLTSKPEEQCIYEAHKNFIDLHYIVSGIERIATSDITALSISEPYDPVHDVAFFKGSSDGCYDLKPGQFMICFPTDAHKVGIMKERPSHIRKIVFKIRYF